MPMVAKRDGESHRHRHVPEAPTLGHPDVAFPLRALHAELPFLQIHVVPIVPQRRREEWKPHTGHAEIPKVVKLLEVFTS